MIQFGYDVVAIVNLILKFIMHKLVINFYLGGTFYTTTEGLMAPFKRVRCFLFG